MTEQMPSFLNPQSNGTETIRYDRLYYKVQPKPHFAIKKSDSDMTEEVNFKQLALDLSNMNIGYVKWLGTTPTKIMNSALDSMPPKPQGDGWNTVYELKVYSVNNMENIMFFDVTNWGGQRGIQSAFRDYLEYCKSKNITQQVSKNYLPIFTYTGTQELKNKEGKVTSAEPIFKLDKVIDNPNSNGSNGSSQSQPIMIDDVSEIKEKVQEQQNSSIDALKNVRQL